MQVCEKGYPKLAKVPIPEFLLQLLHITATEAVRAQN